MWEGKTKWNCKSKVDKPLILQTINFFQPIKQKVNTKNMHKSQQYLPYNQNLCITKIILKKNADRY